METSVDADRVRAAPLIYVTEDWVPDRENGDNPPISEPWCLSCGVRVVDGAGFERHTSFHGWQPNNYRLATWLELRQEGVNL